MSISVADFDEFFALLNDSNRPFAWQRRLLRQIVETGRWPDEIAAPTGLGKSAVVDVHVFANALSAVGAGPRVPRRMSVVVNRRALVDKHLLRAQTIGEALKDAWGGDGGLLAEVARALGDLAQDPGKGDVIKCLSLRGGLPNDRSWLDDPRIVSIIAATPDMWGSRLLFRGYGSSTRSRPREAGLLAYDSVLMLDEAHLNGQLLSTAIDVATIVAREQHALGDVPGLQVVSTTATPDSVENAVRVGIELDDRAEPETARRLGAPKTVTVVTSSEAPSRMPPSRKYVEELAAHARILAEQAEASASGARTVLCVLNNVETAVRLADVLQADSDAASVVCWVGRMREMDISAQRYLLPGLFSLAGEPSVRFLVATQTVEVGIDLDCAALLTELAPGSALAQRFGRVNRTGRRSAAAITVVAPAAEMMTDRPPYRVADLSTAASWLQSLRSGDASPAAMLENPPPSQSRRRLLLSPLYREHARLLAGTSDRLFTELDLAFWLREDLDPETEPVGVVLRQMVRGKDGSKSPLADDSTALDLLKATEVDGAEVFPTTVRTAKDVVEQVLAAATLARVFYWRDEVLEQADGDYKPRPGDNIVLDAQHSVTRQQVITSDPPVSSEGLPTVWGPKDVHVCLAERGDRLCELFAGMSAKEAQDAYDELGETEAQVIVPSAVDGSDPLPWVVLKPTRLVQDDPEIRQVWTNGTSRRVPLDLHQEAVADRASVICRAVGLGDSLARTLSEAGRHHDDGKTDDRFQVALERANDEPFLAKSGRGSAQDRARAWTRSGLPTGWRHEQLSAASVWSDPAPDPLDRDLVTRLVGTSHGYGRPFFTHGFDGARGTLLTTSADERWAEAAVELFATGAGWSGVLARTERIYGVWGCAYLEAILRAADCQVSTEGS